ncbi:MAG: hypothetical protein IPH20_23065 [Bacteroidales bacterium]|nr:hypothetical protein [Bacteroidales bacterium]
MTSINLTATGGGSYSWSNGTGVVGTEAILNVTSPGTYTVTVTLANGCSDTESIQITQDDAVPTAGIDTPLTTILTCSVTSINLTATGGGSYSWSDGINVVGTEAILNVTAPGTYTVTVTSANGCSDTESIVITQDIANPTAGITPPSTTILTCTVTTINLTATGGGSYSWSDGTGVVGTEAILNVTSPGTYTVTVTSANGCFDTESIQITQDLEHCEEEYCTVTQFTLGSETGSFCDGTSSYDLMNSLLSENGPVVIGIPANNRSFTVPVDGGAQCIIDRFPTYNNAFVLTGNWGCGNFGNLLQTDGRFNNSLLVEAITMQFNLWLTPALGSLVLESPEFYIRSSSGCGSGENIPLDDATHYVIPQSVYNYLGDDPTVQDLFDLANLALGSASLPGPNAPTLANIKYSLKWINEAFENCGFIYFVPALSNKIELAKTGTYIDNEPTGIYNAGDQISYEFAVSNIGDLTLTDIVINDPKVSVTGGPILSLAPGTADNTTFSAVYTLTDADLIAGSVINTATVIGFAGSNAYYDTDNDVQTFTLPDRILALEVFLEGLYDGTGVMRQAMDENGPNFGTGIADHITVELHSVADYNSIVYTIDDVALGINGQATVNIPYFYFGSYYITVKHRNSLETVSSVPVSMSSGSVSYSFDAPSKVYGGNLLQMITGEYVVFGGDVNQDGIVDTADMTPVDNDAAGFISGYNSNDVNGDGIVDTADMTIVDNNAAGFAGSITP